MMREPVHATTTGISGDTLNDIVNGLRANGIAYEPFLSTATNIVIGSAMNSTKVTVAQSRGIPCVFPEWVTRGGCRWDVVEEYKLQRQVKAECQDRPRLISTADTRCPQQELKPIRRVVCTTALQPRYKELIRVLCKEVSVEYQSCLRRDCTHLVVPHGLKDAVDSEKINFAKKHNIRIVSFEEFAVEFNVEELVKNALNVNARECRSQVSRSCVAETVCYCTPHAMITKKIRDGIERIGARLASTMSNDVTHVVVLGSDRNAVVPRDGVEVVTEAWLSNRVRTSCNSESALSRSSTVDGDKTAMCPYGRRCRRGADIVPSITFGSITGAEKRELQFSLEQVLGECVQDCLVLGACGATQKVTTHLVVPQSTCEKSEKVKALVKRFEETQRTECCLVSLEWVQKCIREKHWVDCAPFHVPLTAVNVCAEGHPSERIIDRNDHAAHGAARKGTHCSPLGGDTLTVPVENVEDCAERNSGDLHGFQLPSSVTSGSVGDILGNQRVPPLQKAKEDDGPKGSDRNPKKEFGERGGVNGGPGRDKRGTLFASRDCNSRGEKSTQEKMGGTECDGGTQDSNCSLEAFVGLLEEKVGYAPPSVMGGMVAATTISTAKNPTARKLYSDKLDEEVNVSQEMTENGNHDRGHDEDPRDEDEEDGTDVVTGTLLRNSTGSMTRPEKNAAISKYRLVESQVIVYRRDADKDAKETDAAGEGESCDPASAYDGGPRFRTTNGRVFLISKSLLQDERVEAQIMAMGGTLTGDVEECTHYIIPKPSKTETFLRCVAAGKWVLAPTFLTESAFRGEFSREADHEWCAEKAESNPDIFRGSIVSLMRACRLQRTQPHRAFASWSAIVCCATSTRAESFAHVLRSGDCRHVTIVSSPSELLGESKDLLFTHSHILSDDAIWTEAQLVTAAQQRNSNVSQGDEEETQTGSEAALTGKRSRESCEYPGIVYRMEYLVHCLCVEHPHSEAYQLLNWIRAKNQNDPGNNSQ